jgi:CRP/FNR family cyclic AMP-dependent transcriptional regulator
MTTQTDQFIETARAYRLLTELGPEQLRKLLPLAEEQTFEAGRFIFREGDRSMFLHLIVSGEVVLSSSISGETIHVQTLHAGDAMGWSALTAESRTHFQARALASVTTIAFPGERLREACDHDPGMGFALMKQLLELVTERLDATRMQMLSGQRA